MPALRLTMRKVKELLRLRYGLRLQTSGHRVTAS
jgi:hypothetical protein